MLGNFLSPKIPKRLKFWPDVPEGICGEPDVDDLHPRPREEQQLAGIAVRLGTSSSYPRKFWGKGETFPHLTSISQSHKKVIDLDMTRPRFTYKINKIGALQMWWNCQHCNKTVGAKDLVCKWCGSVIRSDQDVEHAALQISAARGWYSDHREDPVDGQVQ